MSPNISAALKREPRNKGKLAGQKSTIEAQGHLGYPVWLQPSNDIRNLALFNLAIDSKLVRVTW
jgi:hypothetical protein